MALRNQAYALLGRTVWKLGKRTAKKKARQAVPERPPGKTSAALAAGVATFFGVLAFWRRRRADDE